MTVLDVCPAVMRTHLVSIGLVVLLVSSGCLSAPGGNQAQTGAVTASCTNAAAPDVNITASDLPASASGGDTPWGIDATATFTEVERLVGADGTQPALDVSGQEIGQTESSTNRWYNNSYFRALGLSPGEGGGAQIAGYTAGNDTVLLNPNLSTTQAHSTLVHEYVHTLQSQERVWGDWNGWPTPDGIEGREAWLTNDLLLEGAATYTEGVYAQRNVDGVGLSDYLDQLHADYCQSEGASQWFLAQYYVGAQHAAASVDDPAELDDLYDQPPITSEQILHNGSGDGLDPMPMGLEAAGDASFDTLGAHGNAVSTADFDGNGVLSDRGTQGELFTRVALSQELDHSRAVEAAAGWGNDTMVLTTVFDEEGDASAQGYLWVTRWDSTADADQFQSAITEFGAQRPDTFEMVGDTYELAFQTERPADDTVVTYIGPSSLTEQTTVDIDGGNVTVGIP